MRRQKGVGMKKCESCSCECDNSNFCPNCGGKLTDKFDGAKCAVCGAALPDGAKLCGKCGALVDSYRFRSSRGRELGAGDRFCSSCGAVLADDARFCGKCGASVGGKPHCPSCGAAASGEHKARKKFFYGGVKGLVRSLTAVESKDKRVSNIFVILLCTVLMFTALFAPVKIAVTGVLQTALEDGAGSAEFEVNSHYGNQSVFKILGALGYCNINVKKTDDMIKARDLVVAYADAMTKAQEKYAEKYENDSRLTDAEKADAYAKLVADYSSDYNILGFIIICTTMRVREAMDEDLRKLMPLELYLGKGSALITLVTAVLASCVQLLIAIVSLIMIVLSARGIAKKKKSKLFGAIGAGYWLACAGLMILSFGPSLYPGGGMFAIALISAIAYFAAGVVVSAIKGKSKPCIVKRAGIAALAAVAFFVLCSPMLVARMTASYEGVTVSSSVFVPLGETVSLFQMYCDFLTYSSISIMLSGATYAGGALSWIFGFLALIVTFGGLWNALNVLMFDTERQNRVNASSVTGLFLLIALAVTSWAVGVNGALPTREKFMNMHIAFSANTPVYVSIAFCAAVTVLCAAFAPKPKAAPSLAAKENAA